MLVDRLELQNFRSYLEITLELQPGANILVGSNGVGKTNLVEAIAYASSLSSHRVAQDLPLVRRDSESATVRVDVTQGSSSASGSRMMIELAINPGRANRLQISGSPVKPRELVGRLRTVVFSPEDLNLVKGDPADRRRFIDEVLIQRSPKYLGIKSDYERVLKQRNALLKSIQKQGRTGRDDQLSSLKVWNDQLAECGAALLFGRLSLIAEMAPHFAQTYAQVAPGKPADVSYQAKSLVESGIIEPGQALPRDREQLVGLISQAIDARSNDEFIRGITLVGPHRDDLVLTVDGLLAKHYASHGECWSVALALRLASFELMRDIDQAGDPVLILDDVFAELDLARRKALATFAGNVDQVIVTAAVQADVPNELVGTTYLVEPGVVTNAD